MRRKYLQGYVPSKPFCVYLITCLANGKQYVGKAADAWKRWQTHRRQAWSRLGSCTALYRAMRKHGVPQFSITVLSEHDTEAEAFAAEIAAIAAHRTRSPHGYNLTDGGEGASGAEHGPEARDRQRVRMLALWQDPKMGAAQARGRMESIWADGMCVDWRKGKIEPGSDGSFVCRHPPQGSERALTRATMGAVLRVAAALLARRWERRQSRPPRVCSAETRARIAAASHARQTAPLAERNAEIVRLYQGGLSMPAVAAKMGIHKRSVWAVLKRAGVPSRPARRPKRLEVAA